MDKHEQQGPLNGVTPHLTILDGKAADAIDFYKAAFGAEELMRTPFKDGDPRLIHVHLRINGGSLMMNDAFPEFTQGEGDHDAMPAHTTLHLQVDDADAWFDRAVAAGGQATMPVRDQFWGDRYGQLKDPFGHSWSIGSSPKG